MNASSLKAFVDQDADEISKNLQTGPKGGRYYEKNGNKIYVPADWQPEENKPEAATEEKHDSHQAHDDSKELSNDEFSDLRSKTDEKLSEQDRNNLYFYTGDGHIHANGALRKDKTDVIDKQHEFISEMDAAIDRTTLPAKTTLYRGSLDEGHFRNIEVGDTIVDKGYMSTSFSEEVAHQFVAEKLDAGVIFYIEAPKGQKALPIPKSIRGGNLDEQEVLLPRGSKLEIQSIERLSVGTRIVRARVK